MPASPWFLVSKPLRPPFRDGTTVMVRDLVSRLRPERPVAYFGDPEEPVRAAPGDRVIAAAPMAYTPRMTDKARLLATISGPRHARLPLHFFFTPNRITSTVVAGLRRLQPRRRFIQSITASDGIAHHAQLLRPLDAIIVASTHGRDQLIDAGLAEERIHVIPPGTQLVQRDHGDTPSRHRRLLYAGDLDAAVTDRLVAIAHGMAQSGVPKWRLVVACRPKGDAHAAASERLQEQARRLPETLELLGEVRDMDALLRSVSLQLFVADHVRRKVDLPLVLLEGMARGVGLVSADIAPVREIFVSSQARGLDVGMCRRVDPFDDFVRDLVACTTSPDRIDAFGQDARRAVEQLYSVDQMARGHDKLYEVLETKDR